MSKNPGRLVWSIVVLAALSALPAVAGELAGPPAENEREAMVRVLTEWDLGCSGSSRSGWKWMAWSWYEELTNGAPAPTGHGGDGWYADGFYHQSWTTALPGGLLKIDTIVDSDFADPDETNFGLDYQNDKIDEVDAFMVATHGGQASGTSAWFGSMRIDEPGDGNCNAFQPHMDLGDKDLEFLHMSSCNSMDEEDWSTNWPDSYQGLHQVDGFHGVMYIFNNQDWYDRYRDFADDAYYISIASAWLDNHYRYRCSVLSQDPITVARRDQCPVALGIGNNELDAVVRMFAEEYDNILGDPGGNYVNAMFLQACDPSNETPIGLPATVECDPFADESGNAMVYPGSTTKGGDSFSEYRAAVDAALPAFDASVLSVDDGPDWSAALAIPEVALAMGDTIPPVIVSDGTTTQATGAGVRLMVRPNVGRVRYTNNSRQFDWVTSPRVGFDETLSRQIVLSAAAALSVPAGEFGPVRIATVGGRVDNLLGGAPVLYDVERMVTIERKLNGLPVLESTVRASVSNTGQIARFLARWPRFFLPDGMPLRARARVLDDLAGQIDGAQNGTATSLVAYLAYERYGDHYLPVGVVELESLDTGERVEAGLIVTAPLVEVPADPDKDGVVGDDDNCPDVPNPDQGDRDRDGVGDRCDNCPDVSNSTQADADGDGTGDRCTVPEGACMLHDGTCDDATSAQCDQVDGIYLDDGVSCAAVQTPSVSFRVKNILQISNVFGADTYDVVEGDLVQLRGTGGDLSQAVSECIADDVTTTSVQLPNEFGSGPTFYYVRAAVPGQQTYDSNGPGQAEGRDFETAASGQDCP